jgi:hypothetical protein
MGRGEGGLDMMSCRYWANKQPDGGDCGKRGIVMSHRNVIAMISASAFFMFLLE